MPARRLRYYKKLNKDRIQPNIHPRSLLVFGTILIVSSLSFAVCAYLLREKGAIFSENDPLGYYIYLRSAVHDGDLDFSNELRFFKPNGRPVGAGIGELDPITGRFNNKYTVGFPLLISPFYLGFNILVSPFYPQDNSLSRFPWFLDQLIFCYGALLLGIGGLWFSYKFAETYFPARTALLATLIFWSCSALLYYFSREPFSSHLGAIFAVSLFLYIWRMTSIPVSRRAILMGVSAALIVMVRQQDAVVILLPLGSLVLSGRLQTNKNRFLILTLLFAAGFAFIFSLQMITWKILRGSFLTYSYPENEQFIYAFSPRILQVLFSSNRGLLIWHPIIAFALVGLVASSDIARSVKIPALCCFAAQLYVVSSWYHWWMGYSFGNRAFIGLSPIFILGLAALIQKLSGRFWFRSFLVLSFVLFICNILLALSYLSELIPYEGEFSWLHLFTHLQELPERIVQKINRI